MILSFSDEATQLLYEGKIPKQIPRDIIQRAQRKLSMLAAAHAIEDLRVPPGNKLEMLTGRRKGQHSIRINDQWRICFVWRDGNASHVHIVDYH